MPDCTFCGRPSETVEHVIPKWLQRHFNQFDQTLELWNGTGTNGLLISQNTPEKKLLAGLQARPLYPDVVAYTFRRFEEQLARSMNRHTSKTSAVERRLQDVESRIRNCTEAIVSMRLSTALRVQLFDLEIEHRDLSGKLANYEPRAIRSHFRDTRRFVEMQLSNLQSMLTGEARLVRAEIAKHVEKITLTPEERTYAAAGTWSLLGGVAGFGVPGAE
jgi:hypothetical protein